MDQQQKELAQIKAKIQNHLISSGNYDIINKQLKLKLYESGWYDKINQIALRELNDNSNINFDQLYNFIKPKAQDLVPDNVKDEINVKIKQYLDHVVQ
ncbi:unnamed protein product [Candida verbasci]|uniref:Transcription and mRNA export factor SUS1 n=1 Tax=Candida verbasci TaxID=1227364 RepID=A0A9W4TV25_9ASCO|nr:unnamed protein product [Candida verbasci]